MQERRKEVKPEDKFGWYWRHNTFKGPNGRKKEEGGEEVLPSLDQPNKKVKSD